MLRAKQRFNRKFLWAGLVILLAALLYHAPKVAGAIPIF